MSLNDRARDLGWSRRRVLAAGAAGATAALLPALGCGRKAESGFSDLKTSGSDTKMAADGRDPQTHERWQIRALPRPTPTGGGQLGKQSLGLEKTRDGLIYVPARYRPEKPAPLALLLHGAGGNAQHGIGLLEGLADATGVILVATHSRRSTWDVLVDDFGPDVEVIDRALTQTFSRYAVDPARVAIGGFSDGASYALSLGLSNGSLFRHIIAFSPGFAAPAEPKGEPRVFISHGVHDQVLSITSCSRRIVPALKRAGYDVTYREFDGPHVVPPEIAKGAVDWFLPEGSSG